MYIIQLSSSSGSGSGSSISSSNSTSVLIFSMDSPFFWTPLTCFGKNYILGGCTNSCNEQNRMPLHLEVHL